MSLEGRIRDLGLPEVYQLLGSSRKSGTLRVTAPLQAHAAEVRFVQGMIADAARWPLDLTGVDTVPDRPTPTSADAQAIEAVVLDLLTWREGEFRFVVERAGVRSASPVRLNVGALLVEAAHRSEVWDRVRGRVFNDHVVPAFVDIDPQQLPHLRLVPQEWEVLTRVDGRRDLTELAEVLGRQLLDVAEIVHTLIGAGVLALRDSTVMPRRHPTPPALQALDIWVPSAAELASGEENSEDEHLLFDPIANGMNQVASTLEVLKKNAVASAAPKQSLAQGEACRSVTDTDAASLCERGDSAARRGDLAGALTWWSAALRTDAAAVDADRIRESIALAARLHALLHPTPRS